MNFIMDESISSIDSLFKKNIATFYISKIKENGYTYILKTYISVSNRNRNNILIWVIGLWDSVI